MSVQSAQGAESSLASLAYADAQGRVTETRGPLSHWLRVGEVVTESNPALIGQEDTFAELILSPDDVLTLTDISFSGPDQDAFFTIRVWWEQAHERFVIETAAVDDPGHRHTDSVRAERAAQYDNQLLELEREHFRTIYEHSPQLAVCLARDGTVVAASHMLRDRFLQGVDPADERALLHVLTNHRIWTSLWRGREPIGFPIRACDVDGHRCDLEVSALAARHPNQMREEVYFTLIDITERNASRIALMERSADLETLSKRLQDSNKKLDQFASVAAHDLLAPLRRIAAFADMLDDELGQSEHDSVLYALNAIRRSATAGQRLVEDILQLSRMSSLDPRLEPFDVATVFAEVSAEFEDSLNEIGGTVVCDGEPLTVEGDARLAKLILRNLLSNAIKYRQPDRPLGIRFRQSTTGTPHARLELIDNGVGMDSSQAQHAFDPFVRLSENSDVPGHGLGLAIAEEAAIAMGWHVFAHSEPDQGTRMVVTAPLPSADASRARD